VPIDLHAASVSELAHVLRHWVEHSDRPTVGDVGAFGGSPVIHVSDSDLEFVINRDTKRAAVDSFLHAVDDAGGADRLDWHVAPNARGRLNRVTYRSDDGPTPGWYAYTLKPMKGGRRDRPAAAAASPAARGETGEPEGDSSALCVVQFVHPGFEYQRAEHVGPRSQASGVMAWTVGRSEHDRKFLFVRRVDR
jgi:hypothetical protein